MSICTKVCPCDCVFGICPEMGAWPVCAQSPHLWGPGSQRCERGKHGAGASEPSQPCFDAGRLTCGPSSGCTTSTAPSCPVRPSVSSTMSSSSPWPARWPTRCWRGRPTNPLWTTLNEVWGFSLIFRRKRRRRVPGCKQGTSITAYSRASWWTCTSR
uniref:Uncharacterized protein n=1 Tax=Mandrillus leucophaeus TaxID=9568 RepID=A0A2K6AJ20_MANLE